MKRLLAALVGLLVAGIGLYLVSARLGWLGNPPGPGEITGPGLPEAVVLARQTARSDAAAAAQTASTKHVMFGDFHVHTTYSTDAFLWSLPMAGGRGVHPIGDACDYARYCSGLDFWAITDHAAASTPRRWDETKASVRQCQALAGDPEQPDLVSFLGFEWTQVGRLPTNHYGHKNVIFRDLDDDKVAKRPIAAGGLTTQVLRTELDAFPPALVITEREKIMRYLDFNAFLAEVRSVPECDASTPSSELPASCYESAATPGELVARLEDQGLDPLIIPHGTSWGFYTPPGTTFDKQLKSEMRPEAFSTVEIYSGHGNSEEYRPWRAVEMDTGGDQLSGRCPEPSPGYLPSCWRAGEIIAQFCADEGLPAQTCDERAATARHAYANMGAAGHLAVDGETAADWLDAGQCKDCFLPPFNHRPGTSVQYGLAISNFDQDEPARFTWGFIASSDNHRARPGTGYKPVARKLTTEANGPVNETWAKLIYGDRRTPTSEPRVIDRETLTEMAGFELTELERQSSFWLTGGLAAVHAETPDRAGIWHAFQNREVYGTSGPKMLLWFDLVDGDQRHPMGSELATDALGQTPAPTFEVRAVGAFQQKPGCPDFVHAGLDAERIENLCSGECDHPSDVRHPITRIEVVRIRRQASPDEDVAALIDDPWKVADCDGNPAGCVARFTDDTLTEAPRDVLYYARAIQEATPTINADNLRCEYDADGNCIRVNPCYGDYRTDATDDCTAPAEHRAWSSPSYLNLAHGPSD